MHTEAPLKGVVAAVTTPVTPGYEIDIARLGAHSRRMLAAGCSYTSAFGTTGEGASLSVAQKIAALEALADGGLDMASQIPAVIAAALDDAARLYRAYAEMGCRAALILPPFYYAHASDAALAEFFAAVVARAGVPDLDILLYNFPAFSGVAFTPDRVRRVQTACAGRVVGIKDSTGDLDGGLALVRAFPELAVFTGDDRLVTRLVAAGGAGQIGGMVNLFAADCVALYAGTAGPGAEARAAARIAAVDGHGGLAALKALLARHYDDANFARTIPPLAPVAEALPQVLAALVGAEEAAPVLGAAENIS